MAVPPDSTPELLRRGRAARAVWLVLGLALVTVGLVGVVVPLLPTTSFMVLALPCFARSSPRLEAWLLDHPRFGPAVRAWRADGAIPRHAKIAACIGMAFGYGLFWLHVKPGWMLSLGLAAFILFWAGWIIRRPEPRTKE